ncbi:symmetrical bis(5'-nucleosyl)-tetraphosphatase [Hydrogenophaga sp.]|uniref:symmetrical bis(5'-nucleosyl)-tetraphosphatase n=1 Tax=Hydrogenophaga sp. TaxID=1904254 RepID=UPI00261059FB|nr:symmetrical bis(5'-nucleosyl)-tetraphosphatase [Hydrogenophaga sp.]
MSLYMIGDVQGCDEALGRLLDEIAFSPSRDTLYLLGDLVNRGPDSLKVLRRLMALEGAAHCLLGNHDLHLLAAAHGVRQLQRSDTVNDILDAPDRNELLDWLRHRPMALFENGWLMVHAGVLPQWDVADTLARAHELQSALRSSDWTAFLQHMYGNEPAFWSDALQGADRLRVVVNAFTRLRFCTAQGVMEFETKEGADGAPPGFMPWFDVPGRRTAGVPLAFGHWSTLGKVQREGVLPLDTGCVWGGCLTAARLLNTTGQVEQIAVRCPQTRKPGKAL